MIARIYPDPLEAGAPPSLLESPAEAKTAVHGFSPGATVIVDIDNAYEHVYRTW